MEGCKSWKLSLIFSSETSAHPTAYMKNFREWKKKRNICYKHVIRCWINLGYTNLKTVGPFWGVLLAFVCSQIKKKVIVLTESETTIFFPWLLVCGCFWFNYSTKQSVLCKFLISEHLQGCTSSIFFLLLYCSHLKEGPSCHQKQELTLASETGSKMFSAASWGNNRYLCQLKAVKSP